MPKIDVILTKNITGLGAESDHVKVAAGYARNYLYPYQLAIPVSAANKRRLEVLRQRRGEREAHELNSMQELARALSKLTLKVLAKTGDDGKMYGSVTGGTISDELKTQYEITLDKRKIHLEKPIRTIGDHEVEMRLHADVTATLKVVVESSNPPPAPEPTPAPQEGDDRRKGDGRREQGRGERPRGSSRRQAPPPNA